MTRFLLILLLPLSCFAQGFGSFTHDQPYLAQDSLGPVAPTPPLGIFRWWVFTDVPANVVVSNQWLDKIVSAHMWQMDNAVSPTNSSYGPYFNGTTYLTNYPGFTVGNVSGDETGSAFIVLNADGTSGLQAVLTDQANIYGVNVNGTALQYTGTISGGPNTICTMPTATNFDVSIVFTKTNTTWYTNGALCRVNATANVDTWGQYNMGKQGSYGFHGYVAEFIVWSNRVFSASDATTVHAYRTNRDGGYP